MKTNAQQIRLVIGVAALTMASVFGVAAGPSGTISGPEKTFTGTVKSVDPKEHTVKAEGVMLLSKKFNLGAACTYRFIDDTNGREAGLHSGQKVTIDYQDADGVLVADHISQLPMRFAGWVKAIDPVTHTVTVHPGGLNWDKKFQFTDNCQVILRADKAGSLADIQTGNYVTLTYETPPGLPTVQRIAQTSEKFTGALTAVDLNDKTLKAKTILGSKDFNVGDHCVIVINGKDDGQLNNLKLDEKLVFTYDEINGVNVVNRIAPANDTKDSANTTTSMVGY